MRGRGAVAAAGVTGLALALYAATVAPGLTWAHHGSDGGDLLAAAATRGVPHPSGYPLYTLLLRGWLALGVWLPAAPAHLGNWLSAVCAALSAGITVVAADALLAPRPQRLLWAALAGLAWASAPLLWGQALITEVYALHALLTALAGWAVLTAPQRARWRAWWRAAVVALTLALTAAHHLTGLLLWPAIAYLLWVDREPRPNVGLGSRLRWAAPFAAAALLGGVFYLWIPWAAAAAPPVNWGYADNWDGFWWLISGAAYRDYVFGVPLSALPGRIANWARVLTTQFSLVGLAIVFIGLADWDRNRPRLRTFALLWLLPVSVYAIGYRTTDSEVYLLPVVWIGALAFANGLAVGVDWLEARGLRWAPGAVAPVVLLGLALLVAVRLPALSLRDDTEAEDYLAEAAVTLEPGSIVISSADAETFALWYGQWGSGELAAQVPDLVLVNAALYQFDWYRRLLADVYPTVPGIGGPFVEFIAANQADRPIYVTEALPEFDSTLVPDGRLWRRLPPGP
jgi:hypothetical protein